MSSKLSVDCLLRLVEDLRLEDEILFYKKISDNLKIYNLKFYPPYLSEWIYVDSCVKYEQQIWNMLLDNIEFKKVKFLVHLNHPNLNDEGSDQQFDVHCSVCDKIIDYDDYEREEDKHVHEEVRYTQEEYDKHIKANTVIEMTSLEKLCYTTDD